MRKILPLLLCLALCYQGARAQTCTDPVFSIYETFDHGNSDLPDCWGRHANRSPVSDNDVSVQNGELYLSSYYAGKAILPLTYNLDGIISFSARKDNSFDDLTLYLIATDGSNYDILNSFTVGAVKQTFAVDLKTTNYTGSYTRLGFTYQFTSATASSSLLIDDVSYTSDCPANPTIKSVVTRDITVSLDENGNATVDPADVNLASVDICDNTPSLSLSQTQFTCADLGDNTVTLTAYTDSDSQTETANVRIIPYMPEEGEYISIYLDENGDASFNPSYFDAFNGCTGVAYTFDALARTSFTCSDERSNFPIEVTASFGSGDTEVRNIRIVPHDTIAPVVLTNDITVQLDNTSNAHVDVDDYDNGTYDNCSSNFSYTYSKTDFTFEDLGVNQVNFEVIDENGNSTSQTVQVTIETGFVEYTATTATTSQCIDGSTAYDIVLDGSESGVAYYLIDTLNNSIVDGPVTGTGSSITFSSGTLNERTTFKVATIANFTDPSAGSAISFHDNGSYAEASGPWNFDYGLGYTFEATINGNVLPSGHQNVIFSIGTQSQSDIEVYFQQNTGYLVVVHERQSGAAIERYNVPSGYTDTHLAITFDPQSIQPIKVYYDGVLRYKVDGGIYSLGKNANHTFKLGEVSNSAFLNTSSSQLIIDEVRVWGTALSQSSIQSNMNNCVDPSTSGLIHYYRMDEGTGTVLEDLAIGDMDLNLVNMSPSISNWRSTGNGLVTCPSDMIIPISNHVTIGDTEAPAVTLTNFTASLDENGSVTLDAADADNGSIDNCTDAANLTFTADIIDFDCDDLGDHTVTITVADESGNESSQAVTVTIVDSSGPVISPNNRDGLGSLLPPKSFALDSSGSVTLTIDNLRSTVADNCDGNPTVTLSQSTFDCDDVAAAGTIGTNQSVTITATDSNGNTTTATESFTIVDNIGPVARGNDVTLQLDANGSVTLATSDVENGSTDNCTANADLTFTLSQTAFDCNDLGVNNVNFTVEDAQGITNTIAVSVTVADTIVPVAVAQDISIDLDQNGTATITPGQIDNGSSDNCSFTLSLDVTNFTMADLGENSVTLTVTDASGNTATATATVTVFESLLAQDITFSLATSATYGDTAIALTATASSGLDVSYAVSGPATINSDNYLEIQGAGVVTVTASQGGNDTYATATDVSNSLTVSKATLTATAEDLTITYGDRISAIGITYSGFVNDDSSEDLDVAPSTTLPGSSNAGTYVIPVSGGSDNDYDFVYESGELIIEKADQTITFAAIADVDISIATTVNITATAESTLDVNFSIIEGTDIASLSNGVITVINTGIVTIEATQAGNENYTAAEAVTQTFLVTDSRKQNQTITFNGIDDQVYGNQVSLAGSTSSNLDIQYTLASGAGTISNGVLTIDGVGDYEVLASQSGNDTFNPAPQVAQTFTVTKALLTVTADDQQINHGDPIPVFTFSYTGFKLSENEAVLDSLPEISSTANSSSIPGQYPIEVTGGLDDHYAFDYVNGILVIAEILRVDHIKTMIYPNPATDEIRINTSEEVTINILSLDGKILKSEKALSAINVSDLHTGRYVLQVIQPNGDVHTEVIIKK